MKPWRVLSATEDLRMSKPKAKAKPKKPAKPTAEPKPLLGETAFCGALVNLSLSPRPETPHKHACTCSAFYSSDPVCHFCSCSACDTASAEFARRCPKPTDFELLKRKLNDFGCKCRFEGEHDGVRCEELDHDPCLVCLVNRVAISPGVTASGSRVTPLDATPRNGAASESTPATASGDSVTARPMSEWHEDVGACLWWRFPIEEPPYSGSPIDDDWPGYHTHWTPFQIPEAKGHMIFPSCGMITHSTDGERVQETECGRDSVYIAGVLATAEDA